MNRYSKAHAVSAVCAFLWVCGCYRTIFCQRPAAQPQGRFAAIVLLLELASGRLVPHFFGNFLYKKSLYICRGIGYNEGALYP